MDRKKGVFDIPDILGHSEQQAFRRSESFIQRSTWQTFIGGRIFPNRLSDLLHPDPLDFNKMGPKARFKRGEIEDLPEYNQHV